MTQSLGEREATKGREEGHERWSAPRKIEVVLRLLRGEDLVEVSREVRVPPYQKKSRPVREIPGAVPEPDRSRSALQMRSGQEVCKGI